MSSHGEENVEVQSLRARAEQDRLELSDTVEELAGKLDVRHQASQATARLSGSAERWLRSHRPAAIAVAGAVAMWLFVYVWRRRRR